MSYSYRQSSSQSFSRAGSGGFAGGAVGYGQGAGGYGQCGVGGGDFGQGSGVYGQGHGGYGHGFGHGAGGGFGQGAGSFGHGAGGFGHSAGGFGGGADFGGGDLLAGNGKQTMQNLNDRLAVYLNKVRELEIANADLEQKIKEIYEKQRGSSSSGDKGKDYSKYYDTIKKQQDDIVKASNENASLILMTDNARLAGEDFRMKYENERTLCRSVEADIGGLRKVLDDLTMTKSDLEGQVEHLNEEKLSLKKNQDDEQKASQGTSVGDVNVEMNAAPGENLVDMLNKMRQQYEDLAEKNRKDAEEQFKKMSEGLKKEISTGEAEVKSTKSEISEQKKLLQALEIELQALLATKKSLESTLAETEGQFCMKLAQIQAKIASVEEQLEQIIAEIGCQTAEYEELLDLKTKLENEIDTYRKLLDGESGSGSDSGKGQQTASSKESSKSRRVKQITELMVNGKVVSTQVEEKEIKYYVNSVAFYDSYNLFAIKYNKQSWLEDSTIFILACQQELIHLGDREQAVVQLENTVEVLVVPPVNTMKAMEETPEDMMVSIAENKVKNMVKAQKDMEHKLDGKIAALLDILGVMVKDKVEAMEAVLVPMIEIPVKPMEETSEDLMVILVGDKTENMAEVPVDIVAVIVEDKVMDMEVAQVDMVKILEVVKWIAMVVAPVDQGVGIVAATAVDKEEPLVDILQKPQLVASAADQVDTLAEAQLVIKALVVVLIMFQAAVASLEECQLLVKEEDLATFLTIFAATKSNNQTSVQADNARLAADDFRVKYESERAMRQTVKSDIAGLLKVLDDLTLDKSSLDSQIESLNEEIEYLKKNHKEEMNRLQSVTCDVTVEMNAAPGVNILDILNGVRAQYEEMAEENRRKAEEEFTKKVRELDNEINRSSEQVETGKSEVTEMRRTMQNMEIELQTQLAMKSSLESQLAETEGQYCSQLAQIQEMISGLEEELAELRNEMETQSREHKILLDIRTQLQNEIEMYRKLLDEDRMVTGHQDEKDGQVHLREQLQEGLSHNSNNMSYRKSSSSSRVSVGGGGYGTAICSFLGNSRGSCGAGSLDGSYSGGAFGAYGGGAAFGGSLSGGAAGGYSTASYSGGFGGSFGGGAGGDVLLSGGEKETMQNLNDRLAAYLNKVRDLEDANADLECKIKAWHEKLMNDSKQVKDYSHYYKTIEDLKKQICDATLENARTILQIDNARLAAEDFKMKYETELCLRQNVEADINGLRKVLDDLSLTKCDLEAQIESLIEEIACLKKNHAEEMKSFQGLTGQVSVEMKAAPGIDLTKLLNDMRSEYENLAEKNRRDAEARFNEASQALRQEIHSGVEQIQSGKSEITDLRRSVQTLEIELQASMATKKSLENSLAETEGNYCMQLGKIQAQIGSLEEQLCEVRTDMERQGLEYKQLLDIKTRLEKEIETYRCLLDGQPM
ncbi:uncharacterized protein PAF06_017677 [Gastrophryne carolinensis]